ncbi:MAG: transglycosylase domain-containing protein, partial [Cyclobacteriaceae bacterium]
MSHSVKTTVLKYMQTAGLQMPKMIKHSMFFLAGSGLLFVILNLLFPLRIATDYGPLVLAKDGTVMHAFLSEDDKWRMFIKLDEITPQLKQVILFKEDRHFYRHPGVNPLAIGRAIIQNILKGERTSGASTITMQVARLIDPQERTYKNKLIEVFRALQLELTYSKDEILQLYFNLAPYGGNIEGIKAAALLYFEKSPDHLSLAELTVLA